MEEREKVIEFIQNQQKGKFRVLNNTGTDKKVIAGLFPDIVFLRTEPPPNNDILFIMKIETDETNLVNSVSEWRSFASAPSVFYIVLPKTKIDEAKKLVAALAIKAKFAWYEIKEGSVTQVIYE